MDLIPDRDRSAHQLADELVRSVGATEGAWPAEALLEAAAGRAHTVRAPGAGPGAVVAVALDEAFPYSLVLTRSAGSFSSGEEALVRVMARVLSLTLRMLRTLEAERAAREKGERQAEENARLVASLQERQTLFERLFRIQRSISHRAPTAEVLDAITEGAAVLLGDDVIGLRLIDPEDPGLVMLVSSRGMNPVGRLAGDEFIVVCEDVDARRLLEIAERTARAIETPLPLFGRPAVITASIGVARLASGQQAEDVLRNADAAMYLAKERGRGRVEVYDADAWAGPHPGP